MGKKESLWQILDFHNPDIILVSETWLNPDIHVAEVIPPDLNYELFRKDRRDCYRGVLIAIKRNLIYGKTCVKRPFNNRQNIALNDKINGSLMKVKSIAECSPSAILLAFIKQ